VLQAKARLGLYKTRTVPLDDVPKRVGGRQSAVIAQQLSQKSITLIKDDRNQVPLRVPREASVLYLSLLDYPANWRIAAPSRTFLPELRKRWPIGASIELTDRSTTEEIELVRASATRTTQSWSPSSSARRPAAAGWTWRRRW
jgi:beta-glucosidase-like glycosyl hydrolase